MNKYQVLELHRCKLGEDSLQGKREEQSRYYHQSYVHLGAGGYRSICNISGQAAWRRQKGRLEEEWKECARVRKEEQKVEFGAGGSRRRLSREET